MVHNPCAFSRKVGVSLIRTACSARGCAEQVRADVVVEQGSLRATWGAMSLAFYFTSQAAAAGRTRGCCMMSAAQGLMWVV